MTPTLLRQLALLSVCSILFNGGLFSQKSNSIKWVNSENHVINDSLACINFNIAKEGVYVCFPNSDSSKIQKLFFEQKKEFDLLNVPLFLLLYERNDTDPNKDLKLVFLSDTFMLTTMEIFMVCHSPANLLRAKKKSQYVEDFIEAKTISGLYRILLNPSFCPPGNMMNKLGMVREFAKNTYHPVYTIEERLEFLERKFNKQQFLIEELRDENIRLKSTLDKVTKEEEKKETKKAGNAKN